MNPDNEPSRQEIEKEILILQYLGREEEADLLKQQLSDEKFKKHREKHFKQLKNPGKGE